MTATPRHPTASSSTRRAAPRSPAAMSSASPASVTEFFGLTETRQPGRRLCAAERRSRRPTELTLPATNEQREALEGMYVTLPQSLAILEYFEYGRFGTLELGVDRQYQPTATFAPGSPEAAAEAADNLARAHHARRRHEPAEHRPAAASERASRSASTTACAVATSSRTRPACSTGGSARGRSSPRRPRSTPSRTRARTRPTSAATSSCRASTS